MHADKCDCNAICRQLSYWLADNSVISMLSVRCLFCIVYFFGLKSIKKLLLDSVFVFFRLKCVIKQSLDSVFVICIFINVSVRVISLACSSADNSYRDIDNFVYHKIMFFERNANLDNFIIYKAPAHHIWLILHCILLKTPWSQGKLAEAFYRISL